ncbi:MAG: hypothetical protein ACI9P7_000839, partial [Candidatus Azotimanducaceae bacterium]
KTYGFSASGHDVGGFVGKVLSEFCWVHGSDSFSNLISARTMPLVWQNIKTEDVCIKVEQTDQYVVEYPRVG